LSVNQGNISNKEIADMIEEYNLAIDTLDEQLLEQESEIVTTDSEDSNLVN
jgi:hypothetical protein